MEEKFAYLIIAHKDDLTFRMLVNMLDDCRNDIYIHMDIKNKGYDLNSVENGTLKSKVYHTDRISVSWGGSSVIRAELLLLEKAVQQERYSYYHLLSGEDLPIKSQNEIHTFFKKNSGMEFVRFQSDEFSFGNRIKFYHFLQEKVGRTVGVLKVIEWISLKIQMIFKIHRHLDINFQKGSNWFSITDELANYVLERKEWILKTFRYTYCCDEIFLQTIIHNSHFKEQLYHLRYDNSMEAIMRLIDWTRGNPYIYRIDDYEELISSKMMFARKFDSKVDIKIIDAISQSVSLEQNF